MQERRELDFEFPVLYTSVYLFCVCTKRDILGGNDEERGYIDGQGFSI